MDTNFEESKRLFIQAERIVAEYNDNFSHLIDLFEKNLIGFYFRKDNPKWAGKCKKTTEFEREITGKLIFIFVNQKWWNVTNTKQHKALLDHEMSHIGRKNDEPEYCKEIGIFKRWNPADNPSSWCIIEHDIEEFAGVVERHGLWELGIERIADACAIHERQMTINELIDTKGAKVVAIS